MTLAIAAAPSRAPRMHRAAAVPRSRAKAPPAPFTLAHFRSWSADLILDTHEPWALEPFQEWYFEDLFGGFKEVWFILPEGNTKTTTFAGGALYHCEFRPFAVVPVAAASREQAEIMYRQAEGFVLRTERLHAPVFSAIQAAKGKRKTDVPRFVCLEGYRRINHHAGGRIQVFAADDRTGDGVIPTLGGIDEPHRQRDLSLYRTWSGKLMKRDGQITAISTRGAPGSDFELTLQRIRESATDIQRVGSFTRYVSGRTVLHEWAIPEGSDPTDLDVVKSANPFSGVTRELLEEKLASPTMTMHHWLRFVCNRPDLDEESWLGPDGRQRWTSLHKPMKRRAKAPIWVGVDIGIKRDSSAVSDIQEGPKGVPHGRARFWVPTETKPVDVTDVMAYLRELDRDYDLRAVGFDPRFFDVPAKMLADEGLPMVEVPQSTERMTMAIGGLYEAITGARLTFGGESVEADELLTTHVMNAVPRFNDRGFTLAKSKSKGHIDGVISLSIAHSLFLRHDPEPVAPEPYFIVGRAR